MKEKEYVIGIDIGGTKSNLALFDSSGTLIEFARWGGLNHEMLPGSFAQFEEDLGTFVSGVITKHRISMSAVAFAVFGIAGCDTAKQHSRLSEILARIGFRRFTAVNDAFLGIPAGSRHGIGICAINGTGCTLAGLNREGRTLQIGGVGYVSNDFGGGGFMGQFVVSSVYSELFRKAEPTYMTTLLMAQLGITDRALFVERVYDKIEDGSLDVTACNRLLFEAAAKNDNVAVTFLKHMAESYAGGISTMIDELKFPETEALDIVLAGSVFVKGEHPLLIEQLKKNLAGMHSGRRINYVLLNVAPVAGAAIWALSSLNPFGDYYDKVCSALEKQ